MRVFRRRQHKPDRLFAMPLVVHIGLILFLAISVAIVFGIGLWWGIGQPSITTDKPWTTKESFDFLKIVLAVVGGIGGVVALVVSYRKQRLGETAEQRNQKAEERNQQAEAREDARLFAEDFGRAAEQLGSNEAPVRLAGMYTLERLAQNTPEQRQTVVNVFCAYLRMPYTPPEDDPAEEHQHDNERRKHEREVRLTAQRILATNLRPNNLTGDYWENIDLDLTGATLLDFNLSGCRINIARFTGATFIGHTVFFETQFSGPATFNEAKFTGDAQFPEAKFTENAVFDAAEFIGHTVFFETQFSGPAQFSWATFIGHTVFFETQFSGPATFNEAELTGHVVFDDSKSDESHSSRVRLDVPDEVRQNRNWPSGYAVTEPTSTEEASLPGSEGRWGYLTRVESDEGGISSTKEQHGEEHPTLTDIFR